MFNRSSINPSVSPILYVWDLFEPVLDGAILPVHLAIPLLHTIQIVTTQLSVQNLSFSKGTEFLLLLFFKTLCGGVGPQTSTQLRRILLTVIFRENFGLYYVNSTFSVPFFFFDEDRPFNKVANSDPGLIYVVGIKG